eukprot:1604910-Amphidinium_carterae.1
MGWRGRAWLLVLGIVVNRLSFAVMADGEADDGYVDEDDETDDEFSTDPGSAGQRAAVEDFDLDIPESDRKQRMQACVVLGSMRAGLRQSELESAVEDVMKQMQ